MMDYLSGMGLSTLNIVLILILAVWDFTWRLCGTWKAARKGSVSWFIAMSIFGTAGILPILYIYIFSEMKKQKAVRRSKKKRR